MAQSEVMASGMLSGPFGCVLNMATGSGKTWLAEQAIHQVIRSGKRAVYLTPLRALANEITEKWSKAFQDFPVGVYTGESVSKSRQNSVPIEKAKVLVMTPERLDACTRFWRNHWGWIPEVDLCVIDEIHLVSEPGRGPRLEGAISRFRRLNPFCRYMGLSATLGNPEEVADWLEAVTFKSRWRPIELQWKCVSFKKATEKPVLLLKEISRNIREAGKSLVFVQSRRRAEELSRFLLKEGIRAGHHHAGLKQENRRDTETTFREGKLDALVATGTLEMGLNLPVRQVVLYDLQCFDGRDFVPLATNSVWQRVGRAGRPGLDKFGEGVLIHPAWDRGAEKYQAANFEAVRSHLKNPAALAEQIVAEVSCGLSVTRNQLNRALAQTLGGSQKLLPDINQMIREMCEADLLVEKVDSDKPKAGLILRATKAGRVAARHMLMPSTVLKLKKVLHQIPESTFFDLLVLLCSVADCEPVIQVDFEELDSLASGLANEPSYLLRCSAKDLQDFLDISPRRLLSTLKMAWVARQYTRLGCMESTASLSDCYPYEIVRLTESLDRLLMAVCDLVKTPKEAEQDSSTQVCDETVTIPEKLSHLQKMIAHGLNEITVTLCFVSGIGGINARKLIGQGIRDIEELAGAEIEDLAGIKGVSKARAAKWIEEAEKSIKIKHSFRLKDSGPKSTLNKENWPDLIDPYRLRRSLELQAEVITSEIYRVTGGLEPHIVNFSSSIIKCDCADFSKGHECKHIFAVKRLIGDEKTLSVIQKLGSDQESEGLSLFQLWLSSDRKTVGKVSA